MIRTISLPPYASAGRRSFVKERLMNGTALAPGSAAKAVQLFPWTGASKAARGGEGHWNFTPLNLRFKTFRPIANFQRAPGAPLPRATP